MALASVADVVRVLGLPALEEGDPRTAAIEKALEAVESYIIPKLKPFTTEGSTTIRYNVAGDELIPLPVPGSAVSEVRTFLSPGFFGQSVLVLGTDYALTDSGIRLFGDHATTYDRLEIDWTYGGGVPAAVRDGVALAAGALWRGQPAVASGLKSERIGDYSYTVSDVKTTFPDLARDMLKDFMKSGRVFVT